MKHSKQRLISPLAAGYVSHVLRQRIGLHEFRSVYRHPKGEDRSKTALGLIRARRDVREKVATHEAELAADRLHAARVREWNLANKGRPPRK